MSRVHQAASTAEQTATTAIRRWCRRRPLAVASLLLVVSLPLLLAVLDRTFPLNLPGQDSLFARVVTDRDGFPLRAFPDNNGVWRYPVTLDQLSPYYLEALLTYEDRRFWWHPGIDPLAMVRAAAGNLASGRVISGGSTLSMQVARLLHPHSRSLPGKFYQMLRTLQLEWHLSKTEILTLYCNIAPFGGTIEGVQAASYTYLSKPASQLTRAEAALLAVLPQSPTRLRPDLHPEAAAAARNKVLQRMIDLHQWSADTVDQARLETVYAMRHTPEQHAPLLARRLTETSDEALIATTIDGDLQRALEDYVRYYSETQGDSTSAAVLVVHNPTMEVRAYVGTADFANPARFGHVDMVTALRSPGSTLKPFLYAMAMDEGLIHSESLLSDTPRHWQDYHPGNFTGGFSGPVSASDALRRSLNIPAVELMERFRPATFAARLANAGLQLEARGEPSLAMILGGVGISLEDLVAGYSAFANGGQVRPLRYRLDADTTPESRYFFSPQAAWVTQKLLTDVSRPDGLRRVSALGERQQLAWKTGTSYGFRDTWAIGVSANYTIGVWLGRPDGTPRPGTSGRSSAGPLLHAIADHLPDARAAIAQPQGVAQREICWPLGTAAADQPAGYCHEKHMAWVINDTLPPTWPDHLQPHSPNPVTFFVDQTSGLRVHSGCDLSNSRQLSAALWPTELEPWIRAEFRRRHQLPAMADTCAGAIASGQQVKILGLEDGTRFQVALQADTNPVISLQATGGDGLQHWYVNGQHYRSTLNNATTTLDLALGTTEIVVVDDTGNLDRVELYFDREAL